MLSLDPEHPLVKLCVAGMQAEARGDFAEASRLFQQAWDLRTNDFEACIAAHYVARHQDTPQETLHWNQLALQHALSSGDPALPPLNDFLPSLYLNLGWSYEQLADPANATRHYTLAEACLVTLPAGPYREMVTQGVSNGLARVREL
jgi:tetratricopeptide (TPR) repeat protein